MKPSETVVLAGAGISIEEPSGIPAAQGLSDALLRWITSNPTVRQRLAHRLTPGNNFNPYHFLRFEGLVQAIAAIDPNIFNYLESTQVYGGPNVNHQLLARMALRGATILTTNFDTRIEQAAGSSQIRTLVLSGNRSVPGTRDRLIKLHGSFPWRRGRNVTPRATLTQIGKLGLGFERFPDFQNWFSKATAGKNLIVIGYSASDSFDVVPLIENQSNASSVMWFSYQPLAQAHQEKLIRAGKNYTPFPINRSTDFVGNALKRLATRLDANCSVYRAQGSSITRFLEANVELPKPNFSPHANIVPAGPRNLKLLRDTLSENPLSPLQRRAILGMVEDGMFGESYATDVEARPVRRGRKVVFKQSKVRFRRGTVEHRADAAFKKDNADLALEIMERSASQTADADQLLLLLHHFEFRLGEQQADLNRLDRAIRKTERVSKRSGLLWGMIMTEWMKSFRIDAEAKHSVRDLKKAHDHARAILSSAQRTIYYSVRAGWQPWYATSARLAAKHASAIRDFDSAEGLLTNLLIWLDRYTSEGIQETAGTACALSTLGIHSKRPRLIKTAQGILASLDVKLCPVVRLLRVASEAELAHARSDWKRVEALERKANELILKLDPADHWNVRGVFNYLRATGTRNAKGSYASG